MCPVQHLFFISCYDFDLFDVLRNKRIDQKNLLNAIIIEMNFKVALSKTLEYYPDSVKALLSNK
uniref:Uncharacterized protein n=1 Tax=Syphacia muris TaxID=451379 RepID=A0A0N5AM34_9BILA